MKSITVFTPTFNRAYCLGQLYTSLLHQTNQDFLWLIVDDGSSDNTNELVQSWKNEHKIDIEYIFKENGGLHTAYNIGIENCKTELFICIDSDDFPPHDAIYKILFHWKKYGDEKYAGIIGLDFFINGSSIGGDLPAVKSLHIIELIDKYNYVGDTKMIHRTSLLKEVAPMPTFKDEKNFNPIYLFNQIDEIYPLLVLNENLCFVEYDSNGMSRNIYNQYINSPNSFAAMRKLNMTLSRASFYFVYKNAIHYVSSSMFAKNKNFLKESPKKAITFFAIPFGVMLYFYLKYKTKTNTL